MTQQYEAGQKVRLVHCGEDLAGQIGTVMDSAELKAREGTPSYIIEEMDEEGRIPVSTPPFDGVERWPLTFYPEQLQDIQGG